MQRSFGRNCAGTIDLQESATVNLLRRVLIWQALVWAASGIVFVVAPGWLIEVLFDQPPIGEDAWYRAAGLMAIALAAQMVLVARRIETIWWWSWSFTSLDAAIAVVFLLNVLLGVPNGAPLWPWLLLGIVNAGCAVLMVAGLAKAGTEHSPV